MTAEDLLELPNEAWRYELVRGRLVRMSPAGLEHGAIAMRFGAALLQFVEEHALGLVAGAETGFLVSSPEEPDTVLAPDLAFIAADRLPVPDAREWKVFPRLPPDLVVEVASPSQRRPALSAKANQWLDAGVSLVWVIWPTTRQVDVWHAGPEVEVKTLNGSEVLRGEPVLPGFAFPMSRLWR